MSDGDEEKDENGVMSGESKVGEEEALPEPEDWSDLKSMSYRDMQNLAKPTEIPANQETGDLQADLAKKYELEPPQEESGKDSDSQKGEKTEPDSENNSSGNGGSNSDRDGSDSGGGTFRALLAAILIGAMVLAGLLALNFYQNGGQESGNTQKAAQKSDSETGDGDKRKKKDSDSDESEEESNETEDSQRKLAKRVWERIPDDVEPHVKKYGDLIGLSYTRAYTRCEETTETSTSLGDCGEFVDIIDNIDNSDLVRDRIGDIRSRHQMDKDS